jgi:NTE family protein
MLFHLGALWRLNQLGHLQDLKRVSSVSGGSILAGVLAAAWSNLDFDAHGRAECFEEYVATPVMDLAGRTIDVGSIFKGLLLPFTSASDQLDRAYRQYLFGDMKMQDIPSRPEFIFNATNLQTSQGWRISKYYMGDPLVGIIKSEDLRLSTVVAASSAFPPFLSPLVIDISELEFIEPEKAPEFRALLPPSPDVAIHQKDRQAYRDRVVLSDGGIADNLGLESNWDIFENQGSDYNVSFPDILFVSDGGGKSKPDPQVRWSWIWQIDRTVSIIHEQPSRLRTEILIGEYSRGGKEFVFWSIRDRLRRHGDAPRDFCLPYSETTLLAELPTRLARIEETTKQRLVNWGYAAAHEAMLLYHPESIRVDSVPAQYPFPEEGIGPDSIKVDCGQIEMDKAFEREKQLPNILYKRNHEK